MNNYKTNKVDTISMGYEDTFTDTRQEFVGVDSRGRVIETGTKPYPVLPVKKFTLTKIKALEAEMKSKGKL